MKTTTEYPASLLQKYEHAVDRAWDKILEAGLVPTIEWGHLPNGDATICVKVDIEKTAQSQRGEAWAL